MKKVGAIVAKFLEPMTELISTIEIWSPDDYYKTLTTRVSFSKSCLSETWQMVPG